MAAYIASLRELLDARPRLAGARPRLPDGRSRGGRCEAIVAHRLKREAKVLRCACARSARRDAETLLARVYDDVRAAAARDGAALAARAPAQAARRRRRAASATARGIWPPADEHRCGSAARERPRVVAHVRPQMIVQSTSDARCGACASITLSPVLPDGRRRRAVVAAATCAASSARITSPCVTTASVPPTRRGAAPRARTPRPRAARTRRPIRRRAARRSSPADRPACCRTAGRASRRSCAPAAAA